MNQLDPAEVLPPEVAKLVNRLCSQRAELRLAVLTVCLLAYLLGKADGRS